MSAVVELGTKLVWPGKGAFEVVAVEQMDIAGIKREMVQLKPEGGGATMNVPVELLSNLIPQETQEARSSQETEQILGQLREPGVVFDIPWTRRRETYDRALKEGLDGAVKLLRDLAATGKEQDWKLHRIKALEIVLNYLEPSPGEQRNSLREKIEVALKR